MLVSKRYLLIFSVFMIIVGISVCAYGVWTYLTKPVVALGLMSAEWVYPLETGPSRKFVPPDYDIHLEFSSNYSTTIYIYLEGSTRQLASNVTDLDIHFTLMELGASAKTLWYWTQFIFEPSRTPCAMRFNLTFERANTHIGLYFSALGVWFLAVGVGPPGYSWIGERLKEAATRIFLKSILILSYFWAFVFIYYIFLGYDPLFFATPLMRSLMLPLAMSAFVSFVVFSLISIYYLLVHVSFSIKLAFLFLLVFSSILCFVLWVFAHALGQAGIPIFLFVVSYGILYVLQTRSERMHSKPWLLTFSLGWVFLLTIYSPIHELGHYLVAYFDDAAVRGVTWWWITESGIQRPNVLIDPESFSSIYVHVLSCLAGPLIILVPFSVLFFVWRLKRSDWWHFSFILIASSFAVSYRDLYEIGFVVQGHLLAVSLATISVLATGLLFFWYFYKKLRSIMHENIATERTTSIVDR